MDDVTDQNLVYRVRAGDRGAYETLITRYYRRLYGVCLGIVANSHDAQDLCQEALLQGYLKINRLRDADRFGGWITEIAKNRCFDWLRKQKKAQQSINYLQDRLRRTDDESPARAVAEAVAELPLELRLPLLLYYFDGRNCQAICEQLGLSASSLWRRLRQAKEQLHDVLSEDNHES